MTDPFRDHLQSALASGYVIDRELTGGGMSRVFVARERALDREVVVKVLPPDLAAGVNRERFRREIQLAAQLQHPHIVPLLSAGESDELLYYTMPFIRGESLKTAVETRGGLPLRDVVRILHDVVDALAYAHEHGVIHRDIKPANVLMSGSHALITDFGVAKALSAALPISGVTTAGVAIGTPAYMAPEQLAGDPSADHRVDLYAVGLLAYELLSGVSPFAGGSPQATMAAQLTRTPEPIETTRPDVPPELSRIIQRCLAKFPSDRPATARDLLTDLDALRSGASIYTGPLPPSRRARPSRRIVAAASVVLTIAIVSALAVSRGRSGGAPATPPAPAAAALPAPAVPASPTPNALTRDDSLAIARAVERRAPARGPSADSLRQQMERSLADSVRAARAQLYATVMDSMRLALDSLERSHVPRRLPNEPRVELGRLPGISMQGRPTMNPAEAARVSEAMRLATTPWMAFGDSADPAATRRLALATAFTNTTPRAELGAVGRAAADSLGKLLRAHGGYEVVSPDEQSGSNDPLALARGSHASVSVVGLVRAHGDSSYLWLYVTDMRHGVQFHPFATPHAPPGEPLRGLDDLARRITEWLDRPTRR